MNFDKKWEEGGGGGGGKGQRRGGGKCILTNPNLESKIILGGRKGGGVEF